MHFQFGFIDFSHFFFSAERHILRQFRYSTDREWENMGTNKGNIPDEGVMGAVNNNNRLPAEIWQKQN